MKIYSLQDIRSFHEVAHINKKIIDFSHFQDSASRNDLIDENDFDDCRLLGKILFRNLRIWKTTSDGGVIERDTSPVITRKMALSHDKPEHSV